MSNSRLQGPMMGPMVTPAAPSMGWKDYFIGAVVASTASYGLALAVQQYGNFDIIFDHFLLCF